MNWGILEHCDYFTYAKASTKAADIAATASVGGASVTILADFHMYIQITAGLVAIFAGLAAGCFHLFKLHWARQDRARMLADAEK